MEQLGAFEIERVVGSGGSSTVYAARRGDDRVALKVLRDDIRLTDSERKRFLAEAEKLARVDHPNVIHVIEAGVLPDGRPYLALPLLDGETLTARIARAPLTREEALVYFYSAATAVEALHAAGLLHRDIKPDNFFVTRDRKAHERGPRSNAAGVAEVDDDKLVLLDFGIAREPDSSPSTTTQQGAIRGTPAYMAPERFFGVPASVASEVYELAATLHVLFAGALPWPMAADLDARLAPTLSPAVPPGMRAVMRAALATRAEVRPASIAAFVKDLKAGENVSLVEQATAQLPQTAPRATTTGRDSRTAIATTQLQTKRVRTRRFALPLALLAVMSAVAVGFAIRRTNESSVDTQRRVALVLKPRNVSGSPAAGWLATAIGERTRIVLAMGGRLETTMQDIPSPASTTNDEPLLATIRSGTSNASIVVTCSYLDEADHTLHLTFVAQDVASGAVVASASATGPTGQLGELLAHAVGDLRTQLVGVSPVEVTERATDDVLGDGEAAKHYAEGLACLRRYESVCAKTQLDNAIALAPNSPLAHDALAEALHAGGNDAGARAEVRRAAELGRGLPDDRRMLVEAHSYEYAYAWPQAVTAYQALADKEPGEARYLIALAEAQAAVGKVGDGFATLDRARQVSDDPRIDLAEAQVADRANDFAREVKATERAIAAADASGQRALGAYARLGKGWALVALGKPDDARPLIDEALRQFGAAGDRNGTARAIVDLGALLESKSDFAGARKMYEDGLAVARELGNQATIATVLLDLGQLLAESGDPTSAQARYEEALGIARQLSDVNLVEETLLNLGSVASKATDTATARKYYDEALALAKEHDHHRVIAAVLVNRGNLDEHEGNEAQAMVDAEAAVAEARKTDEPGLLTTALTALAEHYAQAAKYDAALRTFDEVEAMQRKAGDKNGLISTITTHVGVLADADRNADSEKLATEALSQIDAKSDPSDYGWLNLQLGRIALERVTTSGCGIAVTCDRKGLERAAAYEKAAATIVDTAGDNELTTEVHLLEAGILAASGQLANAQAVIASVRAAGDKSGAGDIVREADIVSAQFALHYTGDEAARHKLRELAKDARAHGAEAMARKAEESIARP